MQTTYSAHIMHQLEDEPFTAHMLVKSMHNDDCGQLLINIYKAAQPILLTVPFGQLHLFLTQHSDQGTLALINCTIPYELITEVTNITPSAIN